MTRGLNISAVALEELTLQTRVRADTNGPFIVQYRKIGDRRWRTLGTFPNVGARDRNVSNLVRRGFEVRWTGQQ